MQILFIHESSRRPTRAIALGRWQVVALAAAVLVALSVALGAGYHLLLMKAAREGWPVAAPILRLVVQDEFAQRDRYLRENLDAMAHRVGEMQAKLVKLESISERVSGVAGIKPNELRQMLQPAAASDKGGKGGPLTSEPTPSFALLNRRIDILDLQSDQSSDIYTLIESRFFEKRLAALMVPNSRPVTANVGSGFGFRSDPFTGRPALHTGLDFSADEGTVIRAAAGGVVRLVSVHPQYGNMVELDHGRGLVTRYAHTSKSSVSVGDIVRREQPIALVGSTGRSTGPHLHFEVLVDGVPQNPEKFLSAAASGPAAAVAR